MLCMQVDHDRAVGAHHKTFRLLQLSFQINYAEVFLLNIALANVVWPVYLNYIFNTA